ncbi:hydrogenase expression protein HupH [Sphingobium sp. AS12]|uniref:aspartate/glutamate racemase family protein n=1 Tax=Sphingobium sp. AS12 TaxID=2849495 RepID=UPI001C31A25F|nr:aspartate/glutamate racemase family protein [Sphingobium sp. AS12]MBV2149829.1 hydrogenase expression protein HupH [Sphingobium sp. AS12]
MILPVPLPPEALANFAAQIPQTLRRPDIDLEFVGCRTGASLVDSAYESTLADAFVLDAGLDAEKEGCAAVCSFSTSDSGIAALRSCLSIPVVGAAQAAFSLAIQLGGRFSVVTMWEPWRRAITETIAKYGLAGRVASVRQIGVRPDTHELLNGKEDIVFAKLEAEARAAIEQDGAEVIMLGSTTMYQSHAYLASVLPCPVINPGLAAYKACETLIDLGLAQSKIAYPAPGVLASNPFQPIPPVFPN